MVWNHGSCAVGNVVDFVDIDYIDTNIVVVHDEFADFDKVVLVVAEYFYVVVEPEKLMTDEQIVVSKLNQILLIFVFQRSPFH